MNTRPLTIVSLVIAAVLAGFAFYTASILPADALLPTHWNAAGEPDKFSTALQALLIPVGLILFITAVFNVIPWLEPLQEKLEGSAHVLRASWIGVLLLSVLIALTIGLPAYGIALPVKTVFVGTGIMLVMIGNALPKSRPGFFVGIRTPWAITDTDNWIATHRLGGRLFMLAGLVIIGAGLLPMQAETTAIVVLASVLTAAFVPYLYSWWLWQSTKGKKGEA